MLNQKLNTQQAYRSKSYRPSNAASLPTLNQFMIQPKKQIPLLMHLRQKLYQFTTNEPQPNFLASAKSITNIYNDISFKNKSPLFNRLFLEQKYQLIQQSQKNLKRQLFNSPKRSVHYPQAYQKNSMYSNIPNHKRGHQRVQSAEQLQQITFLRTDYKKAKELNNYYSKQLETLKFKLEACEKQLREQLIIIEEKQQIICKMSNFNDELCLKIIELQSQQSIQKSKQFIQQDGLSIHDQSNKQLYSQKSSSKNDYFSDLQISKLLSRQKKNHNEQMDIFKKFQIQKTVQVKSDKIKRYQETINIPITLSNCEQILDELHPQKNNNSQDFMLPLKEKMQKFWSLNYHNEQNQDCKN